MNLVAALLGFFLLKPLINSRLTLPRDPAMQRTDQLS